MFPSLAVAAPIASFWISIVTFLVNNIKKGVWSWKHTKLFNTGIFSFHYSVLAVVTNSAQNKVRWFVIFCIMFGYTMIRLVFGRRLLGRLVAADLPSKFQCSR